MWLTTVRSSMLAALGLLLLKSSDSFVISVPKGCGSSGTRCSKAGSHWSNAPTGKTAVVPRLPSSTCVFESSPKEGEGERDPEDEVPDAEGASLASMFAKFASEKGITLTDEDLAEDDMDDFDDEDEDVDDEDFDMEDLSVPQETLNAIRGYETDDIASEEAVKANLTLTDEKLYSEMKERVFDTAGGFVDYVKSSKVSDDDEEDDEEDEEEDDEEEQAKYKVPDEYPDASLTAGEVVELVLNALQNNDVGGKNKGMEIFFAYSSESSTVKQEVGLTPEEYVDYLKDTDYEVLLKSQHTVTIDRGDYAKDGSRAFFTAFIQTGPKAKDSVAVNFILSNKDKMVREDEDDDDYTPGWLIDSMMIRPKSMRRRRRR